MTFEQMDAAIVIFRQYLKCPERPIFHAEHEILYGPLLNELEGLTQEDIAILVKFGWYVGEPDQCWQHNCSC